MTDTNEHQTPESANGGDEGIDATPESTEAVAPVAVVESAAVTTETEAEAPAVAAESAESESAVAVADPPEEAAAESAEPESAVAVADPPEEEAAPEPVVIDEASLTMADLLDEYMPSRALRRGDIIDGRVMRHDHDGLLVNIGHKSEGVVLSKEMRTLSEEDVADLTVGEEVIAYVLNPEGHDGSAVLSIDRARGEQGWRVLEKAMEVEETVTGKIVGSNRGGAVVESEGVQGFIPLSQLVGKARELYVPGGEDPKEGFIGMDIEFKVIELNRRRNRAIFSERSALQAWKMSQKKRLVEELNEGDVVKGRVTGISSFGAFVDLGGADGLIHISELSWEPVKSPEDVVTIGDELDVHVLRVDRDNLKIALSLRRLGPEPWETIEEKYAVGQTVNGTVTKLANFGAFARIEGGIEGLIHISELSPQMIKHPREVVTEGDELELRILRIEPERRRLGLSLKQARDDAYEPSDDSPAEPAAPRSTGIFDAQSLSEIAEVFSDNE
ncbi:MAG: S1 RNA-binding domain-containing protein [Chloroflexi bacterium]|nr:S1 RNA-binding domain-containing protein [Chloroflexota bacterium]MBT4074829.1 S1 RNA-binding domain-containing protein [Chloroflexota bacterium]MBT4514272.1 S1 RNA-binding domain-containing protein [Chloroflexota bacterium]MBT5320679.1 S1 RNA-binding domain-containing protein [Chloroflexota bacterium]MBT6682175.1 S1 RNA-binding domain-containing protein [Chloroflexota bacterium]